MSDDKYKLVQWKVTPFGIEATTPKSGSDFIYYIDAERLLPINAPEYDWQEHMSHKSWVDIDQFCDTFDEALRIHEGRYEPTIDRAQIQANRERALMTWRRHNRR